MNHFGAYPYFLGTTQGYQSGVQLHMFCTIVSFLPGHIYLFIFYVNSDLLKVCAVVSLTNTLLCMVHLECFQTFAILIQFMCM